ncbi:probable cysteine--tRNA ligase, mitochondrial [Nephila pilipes]|uniref:cysteine--tRNA ligase n=1 Tax=Nephila pilipes TaxID=299642 RepID=A0A8X6NNP6_NEPPI|nr:probable cysteine--tRNA ligase, mitochondrial [Nephila pilipes]
MKATMMWISRMKIGFCPSMIQTLSLLPKSFNSKLYSSYLGKFQTPQGYETGITIYNSSANKKVPLILKNKDILTWYICGPTVYAESHIGHACCYVKFDILRRIMENVFGINVLLLMGITDIDDKIIRKSIESNLSTSEISRMYESDFFKDMAAMRVIPPSSVSRVTDNIVHIIAFIEKLIEKDFAYVTEKGNVYFKVAKGVSADILNEISEVNETNIDPSKKDKRDFVLWKVAKENEPYWTSPWCNGRPGWHIECSVLASKIFGSHLDLHSGGYDLLFPHHSNEKSQSEAYHSCSQWGNYWLHAGLLQVGNDIKMSKSIQNTISIKEFLRENSVNDFRIFCLQSPYRKNMLYCSETLARAKDMHCKFHNFINELELFSNGQLVSPLIDEDRLLLKLKSTKERVISLLADDFNTSQVLLCLTDLIDVVNENLQSTIDTIPFKDSVTVISACANYIDKTLETLGIKIICKKKMNRDFVYAMDAVTEFRQMIRLFALCKIKTDNSPAKFIQDSFNSFMQRMSLIDGTEELPENTLLIKQAVSVWYKKSLELSTAQNFDTKKERAKLLVLCDELRFSLEQCGISLKDRKNVATWSLKL